MSEKRAKERAAIAQLIADSAYIVTETMPVDTIFGEKEFYHSPSGLYIHIIEKGTGEKPKTNDNVTFRYNTFGLSSNDILVRAMEPAELKNAVEFKYGSGTYISHFDDDSSNSSIRNDIYIISGIQEAIGYLKYGGAAYLIVPSSIGCADAQSSIQALRYEIRHVKIW